MYPRLMFLDSSGLYRIVWSVHEHGELGHAGWQAQPTEGKQYRLEGDSSAAVLDFSRPKKTEDKE